MKRIRFIVSFCFLADVLPCFAQEVWNVEDCMRYAVLHSRTISMRRLELDSSRADKTAAVGAFFPSIGVGVGAQYNFGRAIDPETNTYTDVSTFYNSYSLSGSLPVFDGLERVHRLQAARAGVLLSKTELQIAQDEVAFSVMQAYADALYYRGAMAFAKAKREQSEALLRQTRTMAEVGLKSGADIAQVEAQVAADEVEVTRQENLLTTAMLELRMRMNAMSEDFALATELSTDTAFSTGGAMLTRDAQQLRVAIARRQLGVARSWFMPTLSLQGGISTTYFKTIGRDAVAFSEQWKNNAGQYVGVSLSVPIFNRLSSIANYRRQRNNLAIAREQLAEKEDELTKLRLQAEADCNSYAREVAQMTKKVAADSIALTLTTRQYEEGIASPIDVQTTAAALLQSRAALLRSKLMLAIKRRYLEYYL